MPCISAKQIHWHPNMTPEEETKEALNLCRPLMDTSRVAKKFLRFTFLAGLVIQAAMFLRLTAGIEETGDKISAILLLLAVLAISLLISWPYLRAVLLVIQGHANQPQLCLFLRAFRADRESSDLRLALELGLGREFRLTGIRPPLERISRVSTLLNPMLTGLRYAGTSQFEFEAPDRTWVARLLATFAEARFVFIDVRDTTPHVLDEIKLAWKVFGRQRVIFIVDDSVSQHIWSRTIADQLGAVGDIHKTMLLLNWHEKGALRFSDFQQSLKTLMEFIPAGVPPIPSSALAFARKQIRLSDWPIRFYETEGFLLASSILGVNLLFLLIQFISGRFSISLFLSILVFVLIQVTFWAAWIRLRKTSYNHKFPESALKSVKRRILASSILMLIFYAVWGVWISAIFFAYKRVVNRIVAQSTGLMARHISYAVDMYYSDHNRLPDLENSTNSGDTETSTGSNSELVAILRGDESNAAARAQNFKLISYIDGIRSVRIQSEDSVIRGGIDTATNSIVDHWGNPFRVVMDTDYNQEIDIESSTGRPPTVYVRKHTGVFSSGPDGDFSTWDDNITSWD